MKFHISYLKLLSSGLLLGTVVGVIGYFKGGSSVYIIAILITVLTWGSVFFKKRITAVAIYGKRVVLEETRFLYSKKYEYNFDEITIGINAKTGPRGAKHKQIIINNQKSSCIHKITENYDGWTDEEFDRLHAILFECYDKYKN